MDEDKRAHAEKTSESGYDRSNRHKITVSSNKNLDNLRGSPKTIQTVGCILYKWFQSVTRH